MAFRYQDEISQMDEINTDGKERYALYAEKAKGLDFTKDYIETKLNSGVDSKVLINQLKDIYKKLNLPLADFEKIKNTWLASSNQKTKDQIIKKYGSLVAVDFTLTNMEGKKVKLSDYKGKMIVLDFWATWCGPCRASFPKMQELVKKYKSNNIEFFFIDVREQMKPAETKKTVSEFITLNKYTFQVLFDYQDDVVDKYKVSGIPAKFLIDKNGNMLFMEGSIDELAALIEENVD
jgi:thiol-disulfide isomerase/thioredoxin